MRPSLQPKQHQSQRGQSLAEYALIFALVTLVCVVAMTAMGDQIKTFFETFTGHASTATAASGTG